MAKLSTQSWNFKFYTVLLILTLSVISLEAQNVPELIYYKFEDAGTSVTNHASAPVGTNPAPILGTTLTQGGTGQFGAGLQGTGGSSSTNYINTGWNTTLGTSSWTIALYLNNVPVSSTLFYYFGDAGASSFRCFTNGVAGANNLMIRGPLTDVIIPGGATPGLANVCHFVYDATVPEIRGYLNGVLAVTVAQAALNITGGTGFQVGGYAANTGLNGTMDEFRLYNRALTASEISTTWNQTLPLLVGANDAGIQNIVSPTSPTTIGIQPVSVNIFNYGSATLTSATISWEVNGIPGTPFNYAGSLASLAADGPILLGNANFVNGNNTVKAWTSNPNGMTDANNANDTLDIIVFACPAIAGNYTINSGLPTGGTNFQSFTDAVNAIAQCGITGAVSFDVIVGSGPYNEQISIPAILGASSTNTITFNGNGETISFASANTNQRAVIKLDGADYVTINNLNINSASGTYGWGVHLMNQASNNTISNCIITTNNNSSSTNYAGIVFSGSNTSPTTTGDNAHNTTVSGNTINGGYCGVCNLGASGNPAINNQFIGNTIENVYFYGLYNGYQDGMVVRGNDISRAGRTVVTSLYGVYLWGSASSCLIEKNRIHNTHDIASSQTGLAYGIYVNIGAPVGFETQVVNNLLYNFNSGSGTQYGLYMNDSGIRVYHNTVVLDNATSTSGVTRGIFVGSATYTNIDIKNNILHIARAGTGIKHGIYTVSTSITSNNNIVNIAAPAGTNYFGRWGATDYTTLALWNGASGQDANSIETDPLFAAPGSGDFTPTNGLVNNSGTGVGVTTDILGTPRDAFLPDPGAYEFDIVGLDAAINWVSPVNPVSAGSHPVVVNIANTQTATINSVNLTYSDGVNPPVTQTFSSLGLTAGNNVNLTFTTPYNLTGFATLTATINTVNGGADAIAGNNSTSVNVCPALSGIYTINPVGGDFASLNAAVSAMVSCGISSSVIFNVAVGSGPYIERVEIPEIVGASAANTITFNGNGETIEHSPAVSAERAAVVLTGSYITINDFVFDVDGGSYGVGVQLFQSASNNTISNNEINLPVNTTSTSFYGIAASGSLTSATTSGFLGNNNYIVNNDINSGYYGITMLGNSTTSQVTGNVIDGNTVKNHYLYGIYLLGNDGTIIKSNDISRPDRTSLSTFYGIYITTGNKNLIVDGNRIHNPASALTSNTSTNYGIYITTGSTFAAAEPNRISNNLIYSMDGSGALYGIYNTTSAGAHLYHNTISLDYTANGGTSATYGIYQTGTATNIDIRNNIISISRGGTGSMYNLYFSSTASSITSNYNVLVNSASTGNIGRWGTTDYATLLDWQGANSSAFDQNSISVDPLYANTFIGNYQPTNPALDNAGTGVGVLADISGNPRSVSTPDPGAYEFSIGPCVEPPNAGIANSTVSNICPSIDFVVYLTGHDIATGLTIQWESSPDNATWSPISGANSPSLTISINTTTWFRATVTCGLTTVPSTSVQVVVNSIFSCYCIPQLTVGCTDGTGDMINNFSINTLINNNSGCSGPPPSHIQYYNTTTLVPNSPTLTTSLTINQAYTINMQAGPDFGQGLKAWIDYNQNGIFEAAELVFESPSVGTQLFTGTVLIPTSALTGQTVLRARSVYNTLNFDACSNASYGETEDYLIDILPEPPCIDPPVAGTLSLSNDSACVGTTLDLTLTGYSTGSGLTLQFQQSNDNIIWNNTGALFTSVPVSPFYFTSDPLSVNSYFRAAITCGNTTIYSNSEFIEVIDPQITSTLGATRCGYGDITLSATGVGIITWYDDSVGGNVVGTGNNLTVTVNAPTNYYVQAQTGSTGGLLDLMPLVGGNGCGGGNMFNITPNANINLTGFNMNLGASVGTMVTVNVYYKTGTYLGSELTSGNWTFHQAVSVTAAGANNASYVEINPLSLSSGQQYGIYLNADVNYTNITPPVYISNTDMTVELGSGLCGLFSGNNPGRGFNGTIFYSSGCTSPRFMVTADVTPAPPITVSSSASVSCEGAPVTLSVSSPNPSYQYSWLPVNLSGASVVVTPLAATTYIVRADDGICGNIDSIFIDVVAAPPLALTANQTIFCGQASATLSTGGGGTPTVIIGTGTSSSSTTSGPVYISSATSTFKYSKQIAIYTAAEILAAGGTAGLINQLSWYKTNTAGYTAGNAIFDIYIKPVSFSQHASSPVNWASEVAGATLVYSSTTQNLNTSIGWQDFILATPFNWNGVDNLEIFVDFYRPSNATGAVNWQYTSTTNANAITGGSSPVSTASRNSNRPNVMFGFQQSLSYSWSPAAGLSSTSGPSVTSTATSTTTYTVVVTDNLTGCTASDSVTIIVDPIPTPVITSSAAMPLCEGQSTILSSQYVAANGYQFDWNGLFNTESISANLPGTYNLLVTSPNGCISTPTSYIVEVSTIFAGISGTTPVSCYGGSNGTATIDVLGSVIDPSFTIYFGPFLYSANGGTPDSSNVLTGFNYGTHTVTVHDPSTGCTLDIPVFINEPDELFVITVVNNTVSCNGGSDGSATAIATGGTGPYVFDWLTPVPKQGETNNEIPAGTWTVVATDANGCTATTQITMTEPDVLVADLGTDMVIPWGSANGYTASGCAVIPVSVTGGTTPYSYLWSTGDTTNPLNICYSQDTTITFTVTVTDDNGCTTSASVIYTWANIDCSNNSNGTKVKICFVPPGNPENCQTICIAVSAAAGIFSNTPSYLGQCQATCPTSGKMAPPEIADNLVVTVFPNPTNGKITVDYRSEMVKATSIVVSDIQGRELLNIPVENQLEFTKEVNIDNLENGMYIINIISDQILISSSRVVKTQ